MRIYILFCLFVLHKIALSAGATCKIDGKTLCEGETYQPKGECRQFMCFEDGFLAETPCPDIREREGCNFVGINPQKKYPDCCSHYDCTKY